MQLCSADRKVPLRLPEKEKLPRPRLRGVSLGGSEIPGTACRPGLRPPPAGASCPALVLTVPSVSDRGRSRKGALDLFFVGARRRPVPLPDVSGGSWQSPESKSRSRDLGSEEGRRRKERGPALGYPCRASEPHLAGPRGPEGRVLRPSWAWLPRQVACTSGFSEFPEFPLPARRMGKR